MKVLDAISFLLYVTNYHKLGGFKLRKLMISPFAWGRHCGNGLGIAGVCAQPLAGEDEDLCGAAVSCSSHLCSWLLAMSSSVGLHD